MDYDLMRKRLVEAREHIGYNRKEFAEKVNIPYRTITNYENGSREAGSDYLTTVATICGVTTDWLLGVSDIKNPPSMTEATLGESDHISLEGSNDLLVALGLIKQGQQLSDDDLAFLTHIIGLLEAWFDKTR
ncbi:MAG: helix-turn-helix transcriptional regulator [Oscillospiraceae bacterium]|nr:helix-turn-helix transcriptional regulator [Oscillospiraceae bacterium]